jgi:hypothetical protein
MSKKTKVVFEEGSVEAMIRLRQQDDQFCQMLRAAIEEGRECCSTGVNTEPGTQRPVLNYARPD